MQKAVIIGSGIGGLATAIRLAVKGYEVTVFEANDHPGGKLSEINLDGFRFDAGPSLFTMPQYIEELFSLAKKDTATYFSYHQLKKNCIYFYEDGTTITAWADEDKFIAEITQKTTENSSSIRRFLAKSKTIYTITNPVFLEKSLHKISTYLHPNTWLSMFRLPQIDSMRSMNRANESFFSDARMVQFFNRYATYNGSNPYKAPATLNVIPHLEHHFGAFFPKGGMYSITKALYQLALDIGVSFQFNTKVTEIALDETCKKVTGVYIGTTKILADVVVSNMDIVPTYRKLLPTQKHPEKLLNQERSSSALIFYWGIQKEFKQLDVHNIFFSANYKTEFEHIFDKKDIYNDPTVYINITAKECKTDAPNGCENWFVMINVPNNSGQNWDDLIKIARNNIIEKLSRLLKEDISSLIIAEQILDPRSIETNTSSYLGALYGNSSNNTFAAFFRHANFSATIKNLYFCGGSVHPGGGIPLALLSGKITADLIKKR